MDDSTKSGGAMAEYPSHEDYAAADHSNPANWTQQQQWGDEITEMDLGNVGNRYHSTQPIDTYTNDYQSQNLAFAHVVASANANEAQQIDHVQQARLLAGRSRPTPATVATPLTLNDESSTNLTSGRRLNQRFQASALAHDSNSYSHVFSNPSRIRVPPSNISWPLTSGESLGYVTSDALPATSEIEAAEYSSHRPEINFAYEGDSRFPHFTSLPAKETLFRNRLLQPLLRVAPASSNARQVLQTQTFLPSDMGEQNSYPISPPSDEPPVSAAITPDNSNMSRESSPQDSAASPLGQIRRDRDPPRNVSDEIYCDHHSCADKNKIFSRVCEWNKHMDKHDRPYKCHEHGCERLLGFTYSGGLLRHNREVHKKNLATRSPLFCPFTNCNRGSRSGHGFTRQENLNEHKRRRHAGQLEPSSPLVIPSTLSQWSTSTLDRKRKRTSEIKSEQPADNEENLNDDLTPDRKHSYVERFGDIPDSEIIDGLQRELHRRDRQIAQQLGEIAALKRSLQGQKQPISGDLMSGQWG